MKNQNNTLSAIDDDGSPVDWWFLYKVAGKSVSSDGSKATGNEYVYFDSSGPQGKKLTLSPNLIGDASKGAVANTLNQIYNNLDDPDLGWFFYNDEDPITGKTNGERGHTKGVLCFNLETNSAFWMIHSAPKFSLQGAYGFPKTATGNAQTFLCITLKDADTAKDIAAQMYIAQQPNVYLASKAPASMPSDDPRAQLINNTVAPGKTSYGNFITFASRAGQSFRCIARNKYWDTAGDDDFYNDLVGPALAESLEVETWEHDPVPGNMDDDKVHTVNAMKEVNLAPLGITPSFAWSEENDHAKLAISDQNEAIKYVCVGDLNFTIAQEKRSGGTVAFINDDLWASIFEILSAADTLSNSAKVRIKKNKNI
ncbi:MAG TPA: deoxyribonuclease II family protein [Pyrinomonadaceae bacterium]|jgi:deoxyribonuclease-2